MKKLLTTALAVALFIGAAQAQTTEEKGRHHKGERKEQAFRNLNLTADQKTRFQSIREAQKTEMEALRKTGNVTPEQRKAIHEKYKAQYQAILTPAQQEELKKNRQEWKQKGDRGNGFGKRGGDFGRQAAFLKKELNLTADQETKLRSLFEEFRSKSQEIRSNNNLSQEQKRTQVQTLAQQYMHQGKAVLTPEQVKNFDELKNKRGNKRNRNL
jgi:Spy/CpxP family protein refolding chaperone